ncbi:MAG: hypothetical protein AABW89_03080 [Nanoarchaeota archaeon]
MVSTKIVGVLAVIAVITSIFSIGLVYMSTRNLFSVISGYATSTGEANLTVETVVAINFTTSSINWGSGRVTAGASSATLETTEGAGSVTNGNWTVVSNGLLIRNIGNVNVSLNLSGTKTAAQMIGGTSPGYKWLINLDTGSGASTCLNASGGGVEFSDSYQNVNVTPALNLCAKFGYEDSKDRLLIDFQVVVPSDSFTGALGDTVTATAFAAV